MTWEQIIQQQPKLTGLLKRVDSGFYDRNEQGWNAVKGAFTAMLDVFALDEHGEAVMTNDIYDLVYDKFRAAFWSEEAG